MQPLTFELSDEVVWTSILESFLHTHEKHDTFTMLHLKARGLVQPTPPAHGPPTVRGPFHQALDQMNYAVHLAHNFSQCAGRLSVCGCRSVGCAVRNSRAKRVTVLRIWEGATCQAIQHVFLWNWSFLGRLVDRHHFRFRVPSSHDSNTPGTGHGEKYGFVVMAGHRATMPSLFFKPLSSGLRKTWPPRHLHHVCRFRT